MLRSLARRLPHPLLSRLYHYTRLREESTRATQAAARSGLPLLETLDLPGLRASDTLFVLGSAWSINDIPEQRWQIIERCDSVGLNFWLAHPFVPRFLHFEAIACDQQPEMYDAFLTLAKRRAEAYVNTIKIVTEVSPTAGRQTLFDLPDTMKRNLYVGFSMPVVARNEEELRRGIDFMRLIGAFSSDHRIQWLFKYGGSVIAMMTLAVLMGYKRIILCGVDLNRQDYFYQHHERYPEYAGWEFAARNDQHLTTRQLPWLVPAQSAVWIFKEMVLDPAGIELYVESPVSTLYPKVPLADQSLFDQLGKKPRPADSSS